MALLAACAFAQGPKPSPAPVWSAEGFDQPESAVYDAGTQTIYVSNVAGEPAGKDGNGYISKLSPSGKVVKKKWATGLDAPKGIRVCGGKLYVADIDKLVEVSLATGAVVARTPIADSRMLNGMAVDEKCAVYLSDTFTSRVTKVSGPKHEVTIVAEGPALQGPNGLWLDGKSLIIAAWGETKDWSTKTPGRVLRLDLATKKITVMPGPVGNLDGIQKHKGEWLLSDWQAGAVFRVAPNGQTLPFLHGFGGPADLGQAPGLLLVPRMKDGRVDAYKL